MNNIFMALKAAQKFMNQFRISVTIKKTGENIKLQIPHKQKTSLIPCIFEGFKVVTDEVDKWYDSKGD
jgi:hypothetical protein